MTHVDSDSYLATTHHRHRYQLLHHYRQPQHPQQQQVISRDYRDRRCVHVLLMLVLMLMHLAHVIGSVAAEITMLSVDNSHVVNVGDSVVLDCRFHADRSYNLFDYPVLWRKSQLDNLVEESSAGEDLEPGNGDFLQVNIMGNINEPFLSTNRFDASFTSAAAGNGPFRTYALQLSITNVAHEDSGNYTCELRGPHSIVLRRVTHSLYVRSPVLVLVLTKGDIGSPPTFGVSDPLGSGHPPSSAAATAAFVDPSSAETMPVRPGSAVTGSHQSGPPPSSSQSVGSVLRLVENKQSAVRCDAVGGFPAPRIDLFIGGHDVSNLFMARTECTDAGLKVGYDGSTPLVAAISGSTDGDGVQMRSAEATTAAAAVGMRRLTCAVERWTYAYLPTADDDQQTLSCVATVPGLKPAVQTVRLDVDYSPRITCPSVVETSPGDDDVTFMCDVSAKPPVTDVFWLLDENGTSVRAGEASRSDFVMTRSDLAFKTTRVQIYVRSRVDRRHFRTYTLVVENRVGIATKDVRFIEKRPVTTIRPSPRHVPIILPHSDLSSTNAGSNNYNGPSRRSYKSSARSSASLGNRPPVRLHSSSVVNVYITVATAVAATITASLLVRPTSSPPQLVLER